MAILSAAKIMLLIGAVAYLSHALRVEGQDSLEELEDAAIELDLGSKSDEATTGVCCGCNMAIKDGVAQADPQSSKVVWAANCKTACQSENHIQIGTDMNHCNEQIEKLEAARARRREAECPSECLTLDFAKAACENVQAKNRGLLMMTYFIRLKEKYRRKCQCGTKQVLGEEIEATCAPQCDAGCWSGQVPEDYKELHYMKTLREKSCDNSVGTLRKDKDIWLSCGDCPDFCNGEEKCFPICKSRGISSKICRSSNGYIPHYYVRDEYRFACGGCGNSICD